MQQLFELTETIYSHAAVNNKFYDTWINKPLSIEGVGLFARNYWEFTSCFPEVLTHLMLNIRDIKARVEYAKILYSELGYGNAEKAHSILFERFCNDLSTNMNKPGYLTPENMQLNFKLLPATQKLIAGEKKLYSENMFIAAGAQLALESQAYAMLSQLYDGARNYMSYWSSRTNFHESCEFFYAHIGSTEKEHRIEAFEAASRIINNESQLQSAIYGFNEHLNLFADFWEELAAEIG